MVVTFPPRPGPPHLSTSVLLYEGMGEQLYERYPGFPLPFTSPSRARYKVVDVGAADAGMIALETITPGDTIARERPLLLMPHVINANPSDVEHILDDVVDSMYVENQNFIRTLKDWRNTDKTTFRAQGVFSTNMFQVTDLPGHDDCGYAGLARDISRVNHRYVQWRTVPLTVDSTLIPLNCDSCSPNAHVAFDLETMTFILRAILPIMKGDEVTYCYLGSGFLGAAARQEELERRYGFVCRCTACKLTGTARENSDYFRRMLAERTLGYRSDDLLFAQWLMDGAPVRPPKIDANGQEDMDGLRLAQVTWDLCLRERYIDENLWEQLLARLVKGYSVLKDEEKVQFYAGVAEQLSRAYTGTDRGWDAVSRNPRRTDWWAKLDKKGR